MSKGASISSLQKETVVEVSSFDAGGEAVDISQVDVAAELVANSYGETISNEESKRIRSVSCQYYVARYCILSLLTTC